MGLLPVGEGEEVERERRLLDKREATQIARLEERSQWYVLVTMTSSLAQAVRMSSTTTGGAAMSIIAPSASLPMGPRLLTKEDFAKAQVVLLMW